MPDQNHDSKKISTQLKILKLIPLNYLIPLASNYLKLNPIICYILSYQMLVWDFRKSNHMSIRKVINKVNWEFFFSNKNVHDQVSAFNSTSVNFISNYILIRYLTSMKNIIHGWQGKLRITLLKKQYIWTWSFNTKLHDMNNILLLLSIVVITRDCKLYLVNFLAWYRKGRRNTTIIFLSSLAIPKQVLKHTGLF